MDYQQKSIKEWAVNDRPREKLLTQGHRIMTDSELLAILLRSGNKDDTAVDLARKILDSANNNWNDLSRLSVKDFCKFKGVGPVKAITIITALEIGRRRAAQDLSEKKQIKSSRDTYEIMNPILGDLNIEEFWVLYLNQRNKVIKKEQISRGGISETSVDVRIILKVALEQMAVGIVLVHNHPSGNTNPSQSDRTLTDRIKNAARMLNIEVIDHVIITQKTYYSFADNGEI